MELLTVFENQETVLSTLNWTGILNANTKPMDVQHLLESNVPPSPEQESYLLERLSSLEGSISTLDARLAQAQHVLDELEFKQSNLLKKKNTIAAIISPYRRLPVDVWVEIMKFATWSSGASTSSESIQDLHLLTRQVESNVYKPVGDEAATHWPEARQLSTLTRVCKDWQNILHAAAVFWCTLELHIYSNDHNIDGFALRLEAWMGRSGQLPWSLKILSSKRQLHAPAFASFLLRNCARWKELNLYMHDLDVLAPLFYLEPSPTGPEIPRGRNRRGPSKDFVWANLQVLSLDGWFTDSPRVQPFTALDDFYAYDGISENNPAIYLRGTMPALKSLTIDTPCHKVNSWKWIPWAQLSDVDLRTADQYEDNIAMLAKCSNALETCSIVFTPSLRLPAIVPLLGLDIVEPIAHGIANLMVTGLDGIAVDEGEFDDEPPPQRVDDADTEVLHLRGLKDLTLKKIGYLSPLISRLCVPALQKLSITMCPINEPEPFLGAALIGLLERSGAAVSFKEQGDVDTDRWGAAYGSAQSRTTTRCAAGPPLTFLNLALENTRRRQTSTPVITNAEYIGIFERTEKLKILHLKDYATDARFLEKLNQRAMLPALTTISFVVAADGQVPERFDEFVKMRMERLD